jgi:hypothetical protein
MFAFKAPAPARKIDKAVENRAAKASKSEALHPAQLTIVSKQSSQSSKSSQSLLLSSMKQASKQSQSTLSSMKQSSKQSQSSLLSSKPSQSALAPTYLKTASSGRATSGRSGGSSRMFVDLAR